MIKKLLFLCTGNYYRSRFSEEYFNFHMKAKNSAWTSDSMGIQRDFSGNGNIGPMSEHTLRELARLNIEALGKNRMPKHVQTPHFSEFDRVIAVSLEEHKPMLDENWPGSVIDNVEYFDVEDLHIEGQETALPRLKRHLDKLIEELA